MTVKQKKKLLKNSSSLVNDLKETKVDKNYETKSQIYHFLSFMRFTANYCSGVENVWVSLLMISFGTTYMMDRFIWLIPLFFCLGLRPYIYNLIARSKACKVYLKTKTIAFLYLTSIIGIVFVIYSSKINETNYFGRIIICTIGWTTMGVCQGVALYLTEQLRSILESDPNIKKQLKQQKTKENPEDAITRFHRNRWISKFKLIDRIFKKTPNYAILGQVSGYTASILICLVLGGNSFQAFFKLCDIIYASCALLQLVVFIFLMLKARNLQVTFDHPTLKEKSLKLLKKLSEVKETNLKERVFLTIHFIIYFMIDTFVIFATYWVGAVYPQDFKNGRTYLYGVKVGSVFLVLFAVISNMKLPRIKHWGAQRTLRFLSKYSIFYLMTAVLCFTMFGQFVILVFVLSGSILVSLYRSKIYPQLMKEEKFRKNVETMEKFEKVFRVFMFPLLMNVVFGIKSYPIWVTLFFLSGTLIAVLSLLIAKEIHVQLGETKQKEG